MTAQIDVVILGGGIAGLWLLDILQRTGIEALVLNKAALGQGQTIASQGIIHGGTKYTFGMGLETAVSDLAHMPDCWRASLSGRQGPDLTQVPPLAETMGMWVPPQPGGKLLSAFSKKIMRGRMREVNPKNRPVILPTDNTGTYFKLDEMVIDVPGVLGSLRKRHKDRIRQIPDDAQLEARLDPAGTVEIGLGETTIRAQRVVLTAGAGNESLLASFGLRHIACQRRPLHQIMIRGMADPIYLHCVGRSSKPLATITAHPDPAGGYVWYVGGLLAEEGVSQSSELLIKTAKSELTRLLPGADFRLAKWATHRVERAEPGSGGSRPKSALATARESIIVGWPTKLALAPVLAEKILALLQDDGLTLGLTDLTDLPEWPTPMVAQAPWEVVTSWN